MEKHFSTEYFQQERHLGFRNTSSLKAKRLLFFPLHKSANVTNAVEIQKKENQGQNDCRLCSRTSCHPHFTSSAWKVFPLDLLGQEKRWNKNEVDCFVILQKKQGRVLKIIEFCPVNRKSQNAIHSSCPFLLCHTIWHLPTSYSSYPRWTQSLHFLRFLNIDYVNVI